MAKTRIKAYWLILLVLLLTAAAVLSVGEAQARYEADTMVFNTVLAPGADTVTSDCLVPITDAPLTVLLGQTEEATFVLEAARDTTGLLTWQVDQADYLDVRLSMGFSFLDQGETITLMEGAAVPVVMTMTPTVKALTTVHEEMDINITVIWSQGLKGTFRVTLPPVTEEDLTQPAAEPVQEAQTAAAETPVLNGRVAVTGRDPREGEFTFRLYSTDATYTLAEDAEPVASAANDSQGSFGFPAVTFETAGTYYYIVDQAPAAEADGITRDDTRYRVCVTVADTDGVLTVRTEISDEQGIVSEVLFTNTDSAAYAAAYTISGTKQITGMALEEDTFRFLLFRTDASFERLLEILQRVGNNADGSFAFAELVYDTAGTYYYIVNEDRSQPLENVTYDEGSYAVTVTVADDGTGKLNATAEIARLGGDAAEDIVFRNTYTPGEGEELAVTLDPVQSFDPAAVLPVWVDPARGVQQIRLGLGADDGDELLAFPAYTCYSLDQGGSYYMLYHGGIITLEAGDGEALPVLLDLSGTGLAAGTDVALAAEAYTGQWLIGTAAAATKADMAWSWQLSSDFLTAETPLVVTLPEQRTDCTFEYAVHVLTAATVKDEETGETAYLPAEYVDPAAGTLNTVYAADENGHTLTISAGESLPPAGTYRLTMKWKYKEFCFEQTQITFFINYSVTQTQTQQEVPNDE